MDRTPPMAFPGAEQLLAQRAWLHELAARLVRDEAERDDLVQEAWVAALERPPRGELRQWLGGILRNRWRFTRRTEAHRRARELARGEREPAPSAAALAEQAELQGVLVRAVLALEEPYRSTVLWRYFGGLSSRAIAKQEGVPEGTVRSRLKRALDRLRVDLDRESDGERRRWALALVPLARLARGGVESAAFAWATVAALVLLALGWSVLRGGDPTPSEHEVARSETVLPEPDAPSSASKPVERTALPPESASSGSSAALVASGRMELLVLDPTSRPIAGARVSGTDEEFPFELTTDELGACRIPDEAWRSPHVRLWVDAPGFCGKEDGLSRGQFSWSSPHAVVLPRAVPLRGRVLDAETRAPIAGAEIGLMHAPYSRSLGSATTGADGAFLLEGAPEGWEVALVVRAADHALLSRWVQVSTAGSAALEIELVAGNERHGSVVDAITGAPLAGVQAFFDPSGLNAHPVEGAVELARSDDRGGLVLRRAAGDEPDLLFIAPGYCSLSLDLPDEDFEVAMLPAAIVEGVLRDADGRAVANGQVAFGGIAQMIGRSKLSIVAAADSPFTRLRPGAMFHVPGRTKTDVDGRFRMEIVPGLSIPVLRFWEPRLGTAEATLAAPLQLGETRWMELTLPSSGSITGILRINGERGPGNVLCMRQGTLIASSWTRPDGTFELHGIPPGAVALRACPDELNDRSSSARDLAEIDAAAGETVETVLELQVSLGTIRGRVTNASGAPQAQVEVLVGEGGFAAGLWRARTDEQGAFELRVPADRTAYPVRVEGGEAVPARVDGAPVELVSASYALLRLRVEDSDRRTLDRVSLFTRRPGGDWYGEGELSIGADGYAEWQLEAGPLELAVSKVKAGFAPLFLGHYTLLEEGELELDVVLPRVPEARFVLTNPPLPGVMVLRMERVDGQPLLGDVFGFESGSASLSGLADGDYRLLASYPDVRVEPARITLGPDRSQPIELTWSPAR